MDDPAYLALRAADEDPGDLDLDDPDDDPPPDVDPEELAAEAERISTDRARAAEARVRVRQTAGYRAGVPGAGAVRRGGGRPRWPVPGRL